MFGFSGMSHFTVLIKLYFPVDICRQLSTKYGNKVRKVASYSNGVMSVRDQVPSPLFGNNSGTRLRASAMDPSDTNPGELYAAIRADISFLAALRLKTNNSNGN
ncbi:hypothetical protein Tco_0575663 [Tanacetum coccineum]